MSNTTGETPKREFTATEKETLYGFSQKIAKKHNCSGMYVRYIINGKRGTASVLAQNIIKDLNALIELLCYKA